jgi:ATP-dependent RNA helicase A
VIPDSLGAAYRPAGGGSGQTEEERDNFRQQYMDEANKKRVEDAEDVDVNAAIHGNWTVENSKSMLHQWLQGR